MTLKGNAMRAKQNTPDMRRFNDALRNILHVSKGDLNQMLEEERQSKIGKPKPGPRPKTSASGCAASEKG